MLLQSCEQSRIPVGVLRKKGEGDVVLGEAGRDAEENQEREKRRKHDGNREKKEKKEGKEQGEKETKGDTSLLGLWVAFCPPSCCA